LFHASNVGATKLVDDLSIQRIAAACLEWIASTKRRWPRTTLLRLSSSANGCANPTNGESRTKQTTQTAQGACYTWPPRPGLPSGNTRTLLAHSWLSGSCKWLAMIWSHSTSCSLAGSLIQSIGCCRGKSQSRSLLCQKLAKGFRLLTDHGFLLESQDEFICYHNQISWRTARKSPV
jgi:hypothetical protein